MRASAPTKLAAPGPIGNTTPSTGAFTTLTATSIALGAGSALSNYTTWANYSPTVTLVGGAGNTVPVYTTNTGRWMQIGKMVFVRVYLTGDGGAEGAGTGTMTIALPVAVGASAPAGINQMLGLGVNNATFYQLTATLAASATTLGLFFWSTVSALTAFTGAEQNNTTRTINIGFQYEVD